jgi:hypothetical protein
MTQPLSSTEQRKLRLPISQSKKRQIHRLTKLRSETSRKNQSATNLINDPPDAPQDTSHIPQAAKILQLEDIPAIEDIPSLCNKAIATIINKANKKLTDTLHIKKNALYKKIAKKYHQNLKV